MAIFRGYVAATGPSNGPQPGAKALMAWLLARYGPKGLRNGGIYNPRYIAGTTTWSTHAEGRACDPMIPESGRTTWGRDLANFLVNHSAELGIQLVMFDGRIWSGSRPTMANGAPRWDAIVSGNKHRDHIHVELSWQAARSLTVDMIEKVRLTPTSVLSTYKVKSGDTLIRIAHSVGWGQSYQSIYARNREVIESAARKHGQKNSRNGDLIYAGTILHR